MEQKTESSIQSIKLPEFKKPSQEALDKIKQEELDSITKQGKACDTKTILGRLERQKLLLEHESIKNGTELTHYVKYQNEGDLVPTVTTELTEYGRVLQTIKIIKQSKLSNLIDKYRFDNFNTEKVHHTLMNNKAKSFLEKPTLCFAALGQPGSGKSHICTALVTELMLKGRTVKYMIWTNDVELIKFTTDRDERRRLMQTFKDADVLYIDDFLKTTSDKVREADSEIAKEIIFHRYINNKMTVISSEHTQLELRRIDEAMFSRLVEMSQGYILEIGRDSKRNERL